MTEPKEDTKCPKRRRINPTHRWTELETLELLQNVLDAVRHDPTSFEKPTCQKFFEKILANSTILKDINWITIKSKMRHLKSAYISAASWKGNTGAGLLENGEEKSVEEYINKLCPNFDMLEQIFGQRKNVNPSIIYETSFQYDDIIEEDLSYDNFECDVDISGTGSNSVESETTSVEPRSSSQLSGFDFSKFKNSLKTPKSKKEKPSCSNSFVILLSLQEKKLELETKKFELDKTTELENLEFKKIQIKQDFELKKLELQKDERIKKYEIDVKYKNEHHQ